MAMNSQLIVYFTCNEIKRVAKQEEQYQAGTTLDVIAETVRNVMTTTLKCRDVRRVHVLIHMLSFSYTLMTMVFNKVCPIIVIVTLDSVCLIVLKTNFCIFILKGWYYRT